MTSRENNVSVFGMGDDLRRGRFDDLNEYSVMLFYLPRKTEGVSSTDIKRLLSVLDRSHLDDLKKALDLISSIVERFE